MKIVFVLKHGWFLRRYEATIRLLAERGHAVHLAFHASPVKQADAALAALLADCPGVTSEVLPGRDDAWASLDLGPRALRDYLRYLHPRYERAPKLRRRAAEPLPALLRALLDRLPARRWPGILGALDRVLAGFEAVIPSERSSLDVLRRLRPDVVLFTPLIDFLGSQVDYLKSARTLGLRTALCVASWDNLTNKGLIKVAPDLVVVWNEFQRREAIELHGIPATRVVTTGAQLFDQWFEASPRTGRGAFCHRVGLDAARPYVLYAGSSRFIAPDEVSFVETWLDRLRGADDPVLREVGVLIRPHPANADAWREVDLSRLGNVAVWPRDGEHPDNPASMANYVDSLHHSVAVVGINTSALIEAGIVGRPVYTVAAPEFAETQDGTLHFRYLVEGGLLTVATTLEEHVRQLGDGVAGRAAPAAAIRRFIESFVRPHGLDVPCTPLLVDAIERLGRAPRPIPSPSPWWVHALRPVLYPLSRMLNYALLRRRRLALPDPGRTRPAS